MWASPAGVRSRYCQPLFAHSGRSQLRSAEVHQLFVPRIRTTVMGSRGFYYAAPASWNDLPPLLRDPNLTLTDFRLILKTVLIVLVTIWYVAARAFATDFCNLACLKCLFIIIRCGTEKFDTLNVCSTPSKTELL